MAHETYAPLEGIGHVNGVEFDKMYAQSLADPDAFWSRMAEEQLFWNKKWTGPVCKYNFNVQDGPVSVTWFEGAETNLCYNALDRHVEAGHGDRVAFYWEGNDVGHEAVVTYSQLLEEVVQIASWLKKEGIKRGDDVTIYMPMIPQLPAAMLACARIGAVHSVVFGGFSAESLAGRILDSTPSVVITATGSRRGSKELYLKPIVDEALELCEKQGHAVQSVLVYDHKLCVDASKVSMRNGRDVWWCDTVSVQPSETSTCPVEWMGAEDPLFKLYTSGSTGKPKGALHTTAGYAVGVATTFKYVWGYRANDVYWCTADAGWITGHSYVTYGPMFNGATQVIFEGIPTHPDYGRCWEIVDKYKVTVFYTAPTAIRSLHAKGDSLVKKHSRKSLRLLGSVGEPINPEAWRWYYEVIGDKRCPIMDTWWQTETGAHMITPLPGCKPIKPGSATLPFFGVEPVLLDDKGVEIQGEGEGYLCIKRAWPSMMRTLAGDHPRFEQVYFSTFPGYYMTGDGCRRDADGYYWIIGRVDDVINVSGHRLGTAEVESALVEHPSVVEAAVVPVEHNIKGQAIYAYVTLADGNVYPPPESLRAELIQCVRKAIGPIATPDFIHWAPALPKTRSGKIMRRILRKIANREEDSIGDVSTLADPAVVQMLVESRPLPTAGGAQ